jgi:hypothetical protein
LVAAPVGIVFMRIWIISKIRLLLPELGRARHITMFQDPITHPPSYLVLPLHRLLRAADWGRTDSGTTRAVPVSAYRLIGIQTESQMQVRNATPHSGQIIVITTIAEIFLTVRSGCRSKAL